MTNDKITDREKAFEYIMLSKGFGPDRSIMRFNDVIESDFAYSNTGVFSSLGPATTTTGYVRRPMLILMTLLKLLMILLKTMTYLHRMVTQLLEIHLLYGQLKVNYQLK